MMHQSKMAWINEAEIPDDWKWERLRLYRDDLLKASDWRMVSDSPWNKETWATYRQALRDLPTTNSDPSKIVFPNQPND
jgi:hypothetical protein